MEPDDKMDAHLDVPNMGGVSRLEVLEGPRGRRHRNRGERVRIAAESLNRVIRKSIRTRGSFSTDAAATELIYLTIRNFEKDG